MMSACAWKSPFYLSYLLPSFCVNIPFYRFIAGDCSCRAALTFSRHPGAFSLSLVLTTNTSLASNRLSSLTIGDSERRSSGAQQKDPSADLPAENAGKEQRLGGGVIVNALLNGAHGQLVLSQVPVSSRDVWSCRRTSWASASPCAGRGLSWSRTCEQAARRSRPGSRKGTES